MSNKSYKEIDKTRKDPKKSELTQFVLGTILEVAFANVGLSEDNIAVLWKEIITDKNAKASDRLRASENLIALLGPKAKRQMDLNIDGDFSDALSKFEKRKAIKELDEEE
jgi:hypothetical protein